MGEVEKQDTPYTEAEQLAALLAAGVPREFVHFAMAQTTLEGGRGGSGCHNWNIGHISVPKSAFASVAYWVPPWVRDTSHFLHRAWLAGKVPSAFRAYASLQDGAEGYWANLQRTFPEIPRAWATNDFEQVWQAIRRRYMPDELSPAKEAEAHAGLLSLAREFARKLGNPPPAGSPVPKAVAAAASPPPASPSARSTSARVIYPGDSGADVAALLAALRLPASLIYSDAAAAVVRAMQRAHGLDPDGRVGPLTRRAFGLE